jgi:hypothetical protein
MAAFQEGLSSMGLVVMLIGLKWLMIVSSAHPCEDGNNEIMGTINKTP